MPEVYINFDINRPGKKPQPLKTYGSKLFLYVLLILITVFMLMPFLWMFSSSFKPLREIFNYPPTVIGHTFTLENYENIFKQYPFGINLWNSFYIATLYTVLAVFFCSLGGYAFAKYQFKGNNFLFAFLIGTMVIPFEVTMIPQYLLFKSLHWIDQPIGLIIPGVANAFGIYFMRQNLLSLPDELLEAARIDGCGEFSIFLRIVLPVIRPAMASIGIIFFMNSWNNFLWPLIILKSDLKLTVPVMLRSLQGDIRVPYDLLMAGSVLSVLPLIIVYLIFQRQFIAGLTEGAVKG